MFLDSKLRFEIISSLLGKEIKPYNEKKSGTAENVLSVDDFHLHNVIGKRKAARETFVKEEDFFDPAYDCDFTQHSDRDTCTRGNELYERPKGWYRMALKVNDKYPDGDTWLGAKGWRNYSVPGEWPVSYHGTSLGGAKGIIRSNYSAGDGAMYGRGIYSTPDIHVAEREEYAKTFTSKSTGKSYKVILQNRINPKNREICKRFDYWLVRINKGTSAAEERAIVENSIRPYGILIKEVEEEDNEEGGVSEESEIADYGSVNSDDDYSDGDGDGSNHGDCDDDDDDEDENYDHDDDDDAGDGEDHLDGNMDDMVDEDDAYEYEDDGDTEGDEDGEDDDDGGGGEDGCDDHNCEGDDDGGEGDSCGDDSDETADEVCDNSDGDVANESDEDGADNDIYGEEHEDYDEDDVACDEADACDEGGNYDDGDYNDGDYNDGYYDYDNGYDDDGDWD